LPYIPGNTCGAIRTAKAHMTKNQKKTDELTPVPTPSGSASLDFDALVSTLVTVDAQMRAQTTKAINMGLTARNWLYGVYILLYEQNGSDRAAYGEQLVDRLSERLKVVGRAFEPRTLRLFRQFAKEYPQIGAALASIAPAGIPLPEAPIWQSLIAKSESGETGSIGQSPIAELTSPGNELLERLSFTALAELIQIDDPLKRAFYEQETIRGGWSVRELRRQIAALLYERTGLSTDKKAVVTRARDKAETYSPAMAIRDPYIFEFLGLKPHEALDEATLETLLLDKLQDFLLELGYGFCFEGRRKRILMGDEYFFVDLVFYHRILKCHVLIELKVDEFSHQHIGQLNTYVTWYKENIMQPGDNPPIGIFLCTKKSKAHKSIVEYALSGMDNQLFVSRYAVELPKKEEMERVLAEWAKG
jgi:predicted nuclease of restriction endonuclease-like (RecB) superfamily